ncbi:ABC transporter ATP-binding protein [Ruegeria atlantica]|uniref:ABC transporter ATP-binding protein n=1 Tax=Ruegeria atlantica TaxID=81569 RepID=UPI00147F40B3|nr:ABC transporter ATP-binding protein [Ruegeria atlantica]
MTTSPAITVQGSFHINGQPLFTGIDLNIPAGGWTCLLGKSGAGKSTVLRLLLGLDTAGHFDGTVRTSDGRGIAGRVSYMAQSDLLLPWLSLTENVVLGARLRGETPDIDKAEAMISRVGLSAHRSKRPRALSGGMRQRLALARTLMEERSIVFLDEPFSALDAGTRADMQDLVSEVLHDKTVLLVTHDPSEACRLAHHIAVLSSGGSEVWPVPQVAPVRAIDDPATLRSQAALLAYLRGSR